MYGKVRDYIEEHRMFLPGERVIVGLSGGADSVCLLLLLNRMKKELNIELKAVHVHHGLRDSEADRDEAFAGELAERLSVPYVCVHADVSGYAGEQGISVEEAGRHLRYEILEREREGWEAAKIAVAHHGNDQAETILYHLFRGTGLKGLGGIRPVRGVIVRPLLSVGREEILSYLEEQKQPYCEDSSNSSLDYARNRIRHQVIPMIQNQVNDGAVPNIIRAGELASQADAYLEDAASRILKESCIRQEGVNACGIPASILLCQPEIIRAYAVRQMICETAGSSKDLAFVHVEEAVSLLSKGVGRRIDLPWGLMAERDYEILWIKEKNIEDPVEKEKEEVSVHPVFTTFPFKKGQEIPENGYTKWFDYDRMNSTPSIRYRKTGDYITLSGGGTKSVKSFMIDEKIPRQERDRIPLIADGSHILWIVGYRISEYYKITDNTKTILQIQLNGGK